jgi:AbrB family looped-hinge helix DNA binding protein
MKPTGITKRIDDCGRIVIPKEVRKKVHIAAGDELEIFILKKGGIALIPLETEEDKEDIEVIANAIIAYQGTEDTEDKSIESVLDFAREFYRKNK